MSQLTAALNSAMPFVRFVAVLFAIMTAWAGLSELLPILKQIWSPHGEVTKLAAVTIALALASR